MTLNAVIVLILRFFSPNSTDFHAGYITVIEDRPTLSVKYCLPWSSSLPLLAKIITHPAARSLCDSWASCWNSCYRTTSNIMFHRVFLQLPTKAKKLQRSTMDQETLFTGNVYYSARNCQKVINNDIEMLIHKFPGKHWRNTHLF